MKKLFIIGMILTLATGMFGTAFAEGTKEMDPGAIRAAIAKYKQRNFIGCISDLRMYTEKDPSSAVAWYYLGNSYMNISMLAEANDAYSRVVSINTVPILTSYSIQAQMCMQDPTKCKYQNFNADQIKDLRKNPSEFFAQYMADIQSQNSDTQAIEIEKLINGEFANNMHPEAKTFIQEEQSKMQQNAYSNNEAYIPQDKKLAEAVRMLNNQANNSNFAMMLDLPPTTQNAQKQITPEMVQMMIMQNQMSNF